MLKSTQRSLRLRKRLRGSFKYAAYTLLYTYRSSTDLREGRRSHMDDDLQCASSFDGARIGAFLRRNLRPPLDPIDGLAPHHDYCYCWDAGALVDASFANLPLLTRRYSGTSGAMPPPSQTGHRPRPSGAERTVLPFITYSFVRYQPPKKCRGMGLASRSYFMHFSRECLRASRE